MKALATVLSVVLHGFRASMISAVLMATVGVACGPQTGVLRVSVRTDLVPGREVELYRVELFEDPPGPEAEASASLRRATPVGEEAGREQRVAEYVVPAGARTVRVRAIGPQGGTALERLAVVEVLPPVTQLTLTLTRDCVGVACPLADDDPALLTCLGGRCVDPRCSAETPEFCEAECLDGADCDLPPAACADALCQQGVCLEVGRPLACGSEAWCSPELGCVPVDGPPMPEPDAGLPLDAGTATPDAGLPGPEDAGAPEPEDAGAPESDAGAPPDAASPDAGAPPDAGAGPSPRPELAMWYRAGEPGPVHALFDSGFGAATATAAVDDWQIFAGAAHPTRDEVIAAGVTQSRHATAQRWDGVGWTPHPFNRLARARVADYWAVDVVYETLSQDALLVWNNGQTGTDGLSYTTWDGATWSAERSPTAPTAGEPQQLHLASSPLDDEAVLVASTGAADYAMVWDGSAWGDAVLLDTTEGDTDVQVAYEAQSGRAVVVYGRATAANAYYRIWDGVAWTAEAAIAPPVGETLRVRWSALASDPGSDRLVFGAGTVDDGSASHLWVSVWDGAAWAPATELTRSQERDLDYPNLAVAFEGTGGEALAAYATDTLTQRVQYRTWSVTGGWSSEQSGPDIAGNANSITLAPEPGGSRVMLLAQDGASQLHAALWTGSAWGAPQLLEADTTEVKFQPFLFLWR